jgi:hypothetical protein
MSKVDELFDLECELRAAACAYATTKSEQNRRALRLNAIAFANHADDLDGFETVEKPPRKKR